MTGLLRLRRPLVVLALASLLALAWILIAGLSTTPVRTYSIRVPDSGAVGAASPSHRLCEGSFRTPRTADAVGVFADPTTGHPTLAVEVFADGRRIAAGRRVPDPAVREQLVPLDRPIPAARPVEICIRASGGTLTVWGAGAQAPGVVTRGVSPGMQFALVLTHRGSFLGSLGTVFARASLFKLSWVGSWTFWLLLALLACTVPLAGVALARALADDAAAENSRARDEPS